MNYENVVKGLRGTPPHQLALPATGKKSRLRTPKVQKKTAAVAKPATPGPTTQSVQRSFPVHCIRQDFAILGIDAATIIQGDPGSDTPEKPTQISERQLTKGG